MNKQDTLRNLLVAAAVFLLVMAVGPLLFPTAPPGVAEGPASPSVESAGAPLAPASEVDQKPAGAYTVMEASEEAKVQLGAAPPPVNGGPPSPYRMQLTVSNAGASVAEARLSDHAQHVDSPERYLLLSPAIMPDGHIERSFAIERINIDGQDVDLDHRRWHAGVVEPFSGLPADPGASGEKVSFSIDIHKDDSPELRLIRTYYLPQHPIEAGRHDLWAVLRVESLSGNPHRIVATWRGGVNVPGSAGRFGADHLDVGIRSGGGPVSGMRKTVGNVVDAPGGRLTLFRYSAEAPDERVSWAAIDNTYFTATSAPLDDDWKTPSAYVAEAAARDLDGRGETTSDVTLSFVSVPRELPAGSTLEFRSELYLGEKDREAFRAVERYYTRNYYFQIAAGLSWCTFNWLVEIMIWLLNGLYAIVRDFGIAIIILVLIVRALLHPITKKGQINMVRMQQQMADFAPKVEEIKKKFGNDKVRLQQETMKLYREHGINPAGQILTCLPMLIQMPIWVALFFSLSNNILMRHQPLHLTWIRDLTAPDALYAFASPLHVPLVGWQIESFNLLPILVAIFMYIQQKTIPKPEPNPNMTEQQRAQQEMMQKMMPIMSIMMLLIFYPMPAGLNLYVMFSSLFGWLEQNHIRKHIKKKKDEGTLSRPLAPKAGSKPKLPGWLEKLQKAAEEAQKSQRTQRRDKPKRK